MPAPSELKKRTQVVQRLVDEEKSYQKELRDDEAKIKKREEDTTNTDGNAAFELNQLVRVNAPAHFPSIHQGLEDRHLY